MSGKTLTMQKDNFDTGVPDVLPVNLDVVEEVLRYLFNSKVWHDDIEALHRKVRGWKGRIYQVGDAAPVAAKHDGLSLIPTPAALRIVRESPELTAVALVAMRDGAAVTIFPPDPVLDAAPTKEPLPITAELAGAANALIEQYAPAAESTTTVQVALGSLKRWIESDGQYPKIAEATWKELPPSKDAIEGVVIASPAGVVTSSPAPSVVITPELVAKAKRMRKDDAAKWTWKRLADELGVDRKDLYEACRDPLAPPAAE